MPFREIAERVAALSGTSDGIRLLHVTDFHNRRPGFRLFRELTAVLRPELVVNTGDLFGVGGPVERLLVRTALRINSPTVFAPGNHDSPVTRQEMRRLGAAVLDRPKLVEVSGVPIWGYPDPNRTVWIFGSYRRRLVTEAAARLGDELSGIDRPFLVAVHNEPMAPSPPAVCKLVLSGHWHSVRLRKAGPTIFLRTGSIGGRTVMKKAMRFSLIDLQPKSLTPLAIRLFEVVGGKVLVDSPDLSAL
ncbi:MAG: metallophosphoesterase family protein [Actinomycetota bacterium]